MARKIITCKACKARFDVARYPPGSRVRCGRCSQVLTVPVDVPTGAEPARPVVQPTSPASAAPPPRAATGMAPPPRSGIGGAKQRRVVTAAGGRHSQDRDPLLGETLFDQYRIVRKLGEGGYGAVYEAHDVTLERRMAVKVMLRSRAKSREYVAKFLREARTAAQLSHPNVVGVHGVGFDKKHELHFLSMEYVEGRTIHDILQESGALPEDDAIEYIAQACRGLGAAHERNIIHRDIKPGNLMVTAAGIVKIADFGLAKVYDPDGAQSTVIGTPYFMPPEQFEGKAKDGRTDIYALGVTFYYMLTMRRPHTGNGPAQILLSVMSQEPTSICEHRPELPEGLWTIVRRMIHKDPDERYATCEEIVRDLEALRGGVDPEDEPVYCPGCGVPNPTDAEACGKCGASLLETCPVCGAEDLAGTRFCGDCGSNIPEERAVATLVEDAATAIADGRLDEADAHLEQALSRSPENLGVATARQSLERRREEWRRHCDDVRGLLGEGRARDAHARIEELREHFPGLADFAVLESDVRSALAAQDPSAAADADAQQKARRLEEEGRIREALVAWRGVLVLSPDHTEAQDGERRLAARVDRAEALFSEATEQIAIGDPETAVERLLEANVVLPGDALIEGRMEETRRAAAELSSELAAIENALAEGQSSRVVVPRLLALRERFPGSASVAEAVVRAETAGERATADAIRERVERAVQQGRLAHQAGRPRDALTAWREAVNLDPTHREAADGLALAERKIGEFESLMQQSRALQTSGDPERALERAEAALRLLPADPQAEAQRARSRTELETMRHEAERLRNAIQNDPDDDVLQWAQDLADRFSGSALASEVLAEVEERCREAADKEVGERFAKLLARGTQLEVDGNVRAAVDVFEDAAKLAPDNDDAAAGLARNRARLEAALERSREAAALLDEGRPEDAQAAARESLDLLGDQPDTAALLARARSATAVIERAVRSIREDLSGDAALVQVKRVAEIADRYPGSARARELVLRAERIVEDSDRTALHRRLGEARRAAECALEEGRLTAAEAACVEIFGVRADDANAIGIRDMVKARREIAESRETEGRAALDEGRVAEAADALRAAVDADPERATAQEALADAEAALARAQAQLDEAVAAARGASDGPRHELAGWEAVLALDADHEEALEESTHLRKVLADAESSLAAGLARLTDSDPEAALPHLESAARLLGAADGLAETIETARAEIESLRSGLQALERELATAEGDLDGTLVRAEALAERFPASSDAGRFVERVRHQAAERRRALAVTRVKALVRERRFGDAVTLAASFRDDGIDTPELAAAVAQAETALTQMTALHTRLESAREDGRLEDVRDVCREILHALPDDPRAREILGEVEETLREVAARRDQAETARRRGDVETALRLYREVLELQPGSDRIEKIVERLEKEASERRTLVDSTVTAVTLGHVGDARTHARRLLDRYPDDDDARDLEGIAFGIARAVDAALRRAERAAEVGSPDARRIAQESVDLALRLAPADERAAALRRRLDAPPQAADESAATDATPEI